MWRKTSVRLASTLVLSAALVSAPLAANAVTPSAPQHVTSSGGSLTVTEVQKALDIIQAHTTGTDRKFNYSKLVADGVPAEIATEYAGVLQAAGQSYVAPASARAAIDTDAALYKPQVDAYAASRHVSPDSIDWGDVLRVAGSYLECLAIRETLLFWYPLAFCIPNPDGNGTWLVMIG